MCLIIVSIIVAINNKMDQFKAAGLHVDGDGNLKILSEENELHSRTASTKCKAFVAGEYNRLAETEEEYLYDSNREVYII